MQSRYVSLNNVYRTIASPHLLRCVLLGLSLLSPPQPVTAQGLDNFERGRLRDMLKTIKDDLRKNYYDPNFHGINLEERFKVADEKLQQVPSLGQGFATIAQVLLDFNDSHTFFVPPQLAAKFEYGLQMQMVGDRCLVYAVKPGSDAEAKGIKPGDQILSFNGYKPSRENLWKIRYLFYTLRPQPEIKIALQNPSGAQRQVDVTTKVQQLKRVLDVSGKNAGLDVNDLLREIEDEGRANAHRVVEIGDNLHIWKMPRFDLEAQQIDTIIDKVKNRNLLILDLRGNGGGAVTTLQRLVGNFFEQDVKIGDQIGRKENKPLIAKTRGASGFKGKLVVLVDSQSGSASELFARVIQLNKRGVVIGDQTAGAVMESIRPSHNSGGDRVVFFSASITIADLIMTDGKSLEKVGVTPDEIALPKAEDMAANRDTGLTRAAEMLGIKLPPEKAGTLFPIEWSK